jgi:two-component system chemotaxis response regulator CheB
VTRVLLIDDSPLARRLLARAILAAGLELAGETAELELASELIERLCPDVVVLDVERAGGDGSSWLSLLSQLTREHALPFIVCSSLGASTAAAQRTLGAGALAVVSKPTLGYREDQLAHDLGAAIRRAAPVPRRPPGESTDREEPAPLASTAEHEVRVIAIGASTGGTAALERLLGELLPEGPPVLIVQHLPSAQIISAFATRLNRDLRCPVEVAREGEPLLPGAVWIAPGDRHLVLASRAGELHIKLHAHDRVHGHRPAVDVLFQSLVALERGAIGVLLTGMGSDGAHGLNQMHAAGAHTIVQDEASSVVWGMPKAALDLGAADEILPLRSIAQRLNELSRGGPRRCRKEM